MNKIFEIIALNQLGFRRHFLARSLASVGFLAPVSRSADGILPQRYPTFPADAPAEFSTLRFSHRYHPASEVSADFFSAVRLSDETAGDL